MTSFEQLKSKYNWVPIRNCPDRFVLREEDKTISLENLVGEEIETHEFQVEKAKDTVIVSRIDDGGLISYRKPDNTYLHTLNTIDGFERKLAQLRIKL